MRDGSTGFRPLKASLAKTDALLNPLPCCALAATVPCCHVLDYAAPYGPVVAARHSLYHSAGSGLIKCLSVGVGADPSGNGYLVHSFDLARPGGATAATGLGEQEEEEEELWGGGDESVDATAELEDSGTLARDTDLTAPALVRAELHVVLSPVYAQPLMMFNLYSAGTNALLPHADVCALVERWVSRQSGADAPSTAGEGVSGVMQTPAVTQQEHPVLGTPFYALHGCETARLMATMRHCEDDPGYVLGWLSLVAPLVTLKLPIELVAAVMEAS